jgi:hypothetical protein
VLLAIEDLPRRLADGENAASRQGDAAEPRVADELHAGFDLSRGPLLRAALFGSRRLFLVAHHLVVDGVS